MAGRAKSGTLTSNVVTSVEITDAWPAGIEVINRSGTGEIWVRLDGVNPTVAGDDCYVVLGARRFEPQTVGRESVTVKLISSGALKYTVEGTVRWAKTA